MAMIERRARMQAAASPVNRLHTRAALYHRPMTIPG